MIPKPRRLIDRKSIEAARKPWCEVCGKAGPTQVHHWEHTRGAGGGDEAHNLIALCVSCHTKAHNGEIGRERLREIVRRREN
ncbi:MAG TPA: HNH endonuclease [Firmicutes bacterium]|nr:HNH endonuclease [Bacillota bacterium]